MALRLAAALTLAALLPGAYFVAIRPAQLRWGATAEEVTRAIPGDELVPSPTFCATRAITIDGSAAKIWPWLAQMGYDRAGFYGYDLIENLGSRSGIRSAKGIVPAWQHPQTGDVLPISAVARMYFGEIEADRYLIWRGRTNPSDGSIVWALYPMDAGHTRLVSRIRLHYRWTQTALVLDLFTEFADPVAVPKILHGVKDRVEGRAPESLALEGIQIAVWVAAAGELAAALWLLFCWRRWWRAWLAGLAAGVTLLFVLYARAPVWMGAALVFGVFGMMFLASRTDSENPQDA